MRVVIQRVSQASVTVDGEITAKIGHGLLVLAAFENDDNETDLAWMARKLVHSRLFSDENGVMNHDVQAVNGEILAVSQFTLYASVRKGNRPSWSRAAKGDVSRPLFERFVEMLTCEFGKSVATGIFGADMKVSLVNDGPITLTIDSKDIE